MSFSINDVVIFDTTLRDGGQTSGITYTVNDKLKLIQMLSDFGVDYIEVGWPGTNSVDTELFQLLELQKIKNTKITAFCMTDRNLENINLKNIITFNPQYITVVGKTWDFHVKDALQIKLEDNLNIIQNSVLYLQKHTIEVLFDAEHFFDGYKANPVYTLQCIKAAHNAGADWIVLCDTNGGTLPHEIYKIASEIVSKLPDVNFGIHCHNDLECAVANSIAAVSAGVKMIQGTINGIGERCGNANLTSIIPILILKMGLKCNISYENLKNLTNISSSLNIVLNSDNNKYQPFVGSSAFTHKAGLHASAVQKNSRLYEHVDPSIIGNKNKILVSGQSGKSNIISMLNNVGLTDVKYHDITYITKLTNEVKKLEFDGYNYENSDASFKLLAHKVYGDYVSFFDIPSFKVITQKYQDSSTTSEAIVRIEIDNKVELHVAEGDGPVSAIDNALNIVLKKKFPKLVNIKLKDFKVRIVSHGFDGTSSITRVNIEYCDLITGETWSTVGVSENIINASFQGIYDAITWYLMKSEYNQNH